MATWGLTAFTPSSRVQTCSVGSGLSSSLVVDMSVDISVLASPNTGLQTSQVHPNSLYY